MDISEICGTFRLGLLTSCEWKSSFEDGRVVATTSTIRKM